VLSAIHKEEVVKVFDWIFGETVTLEIGSPIFSIDGVSTDSHCFHHHHHYFVGSRKMADLSRSFVAC
jgi:hypothetical protein